MIVVDTSALSAVMHDVPAAVSRLRRLSPDQVAITAPVAAEIHFGLSRLEARSRKRLLLAKTYNEIRGATPFYDWDEPAAIEFGRLKAQLERGGKLIEDFDLAIAAIALSRGVGVATLNVRHFARIDGLLVEDWSSD
jgi:tRNA(fMet)-specific endonuclease VapC